MARELVLHGLNDMVRPEWLAVVLADMAVGAEAGFRTQIASELAGEIVLNNDNPFAGRKYARDFVSVEGDDPFDVKMIGYDAFLRGEFLDGFLDDAVRRTPADQGHLGPSRAEE